MNTKLEKRLRWMIALLAVALAMLTLPQAAIADDDDPPGRVARLNYIQGSVSFQPAGEQDWVQAFTNRPVTTGDRIWADQGARAELQIGAATIRLNDSTGFSFLNLDDRTVQIELTEGTVDIRVRRLDRDDIFEVDTPNQAFSILRPGRYRIQASGDGNSTYVVVRSGEGEATGGGQTYTMRSGESGTFTGTDYLEADVYQSGDRDDFDSWGDERERHYDDSRSARYVSPDVVGYEDLDDYGSWNSDSEYGNVWMPTRVDSDWAPYRNGHWAWISPWGWTWVDDAPWGYAPFHYGRWVSVRGRWGWIPGPREVRPVYAPALVVFIGGGGGGGGFGVNVGWFPLGPREVYVPSYHVSRGYVDRVNVSNTTVNVTTITNVYNTQITNNVTNTHITYVNRNVRGGVTAVPQTTFASAQPVARAVVVVNQRQIAAASVNRRAAVAPTRNSVLGPAASNANRVARPPAAIAQRSVVAKAPPPPPPVSFEKQQRALEAHPGQPLARHEVETLRPARVAAERPQARQAPPGKPATPNTNRPNANRPNAQPAAGNARPANEPPANTGNKSANTPEANAPGQRPQPGRNDRPPSAQQQQAEQTRQQQQADKAREQQATQQQRQEKARQQQQDQQQADQTRKQQQDQQQADQTRKQQQDQRQADQTRKQQQDQQQADQVRQRQQDQQQADQTRKQQQDQQQADRARQRQQDQQQADQARKQQQDQQQADRARQRQADQQQADQARKQQQDQQQADRARQRQADQQRPDRPPNAQAGERPKNQPEAKPKRPLTKEEKAQEEKKKREEQQPPQ